MRRRHPLSLVALLAASALAPAVGIPAAPVGAARYSTTRVEIATGVTLLKVTDSVGPNRIRVLKIDPTLGATIDVGLAGKTWPSYAKTSAIAAAYGAIGAINGDFNSGSGHPSHPFLEDGVVATSGLTVGWSFGMKQDESGAYIGPSRVKSRALDLTAGTAYTVSRWNADKPRRGEIAAFTTQGGTAEQPPNGACYARLTATTGPRWNADMTRIEREFMLGRRVCRRDSLLPDRQNQVLLASNAQTGAAARWIKDIPDRGGVRLTWNMQDWIGVVDVQGGMPLLLDNGVNVAPASCGSYFCKRNPRTGIGVTSTGKILFITVDGRQKRSVGMTLPEFAAEFKRHGAVWAVNFDGGGSTTMVADLPGDTGLTVVNKPANTNNNERWVPSAMLVLPGPDPGEPASLAAPRSSSTALPSTSPSSGQVVSAIPEEAKVALAEAVTDPASTGGLLAALASGGLGFGGELPASLQEIADRYAAARARAGLPA